MRAATIAEQILPAVAIEGLQRLLRRPGFFGQYASFQDALSRSTGYRSDYIAKSVAARARTSSVQVSTRILQVLATFSIMRPTPVSVLDIGGGHGGHFYALRPFFPSLKWTILETPEMVAACRNSDIRYVDDKNDLASTYDAVIMCSVLPYLPDPYGALHTFSALSPYLILQRVPLISAPDRITIQRTTRALYAASYPAWFFNEERFMRAVQGCGHIILHWHDETDSYLLNGRRIVLQGLAVHRPHTKETL
jgi:putative methyltransferase (TIGR04325 family)